MLTPETPDCVAEEGLPMEVADAPLTESTPVIGSQLDFAAIYEQHKPMMLGIAVGRFGVPEGDAEALAHEVFVDLILKADRVTDARSWLVASIYNASRYYLRVRGRSEPLPVDFAEQPDPHLARVVEMWPDQLAAREAFSCTTAKCQLALRLRYFEAYTIPEIAAELGTTNRYAAKLVGECLKQAQRRYTRMDRSTKEQK